MSDPISESVAPSTSIPTSPSSSKERVLVLASSDATAASMTAPLDETNVPCVPFTALPPLIEALQDGAEALLVDEDAITEQAVRLLAKAMAERAPWSNLPIIIFTSGTPGAIQRLNELDLFGPATSSNVTILERPVHDVTLKTVVRSALRARRRQYEVRDLMEHLRSTNEQLRESQVALQHTNATLEERVEARTQQVRELALALTTAEQHERTRISQVLHDHLQQLLHGARIWTESIAKEGTEASPEAPDRILDLLNEALTTTRSLTAELNPPVLQEEGLRDALDWLATHVKKTHGLHLHLDVSPDVHVPTQDLQTLLFRSVRELVFNVVKHANVDTATLHAHQTNEHCVIEVTDEGVGFDPDTLTDDATPDAHFGLFSVRERLSLVGGALTIEATPGEGTRARIEVPLSD